MIFRDAHDFKQVMFLQKYLKDIDGLGFIAGGCFKNIFKNEKVKDVDVFFECEDDFDSACDILSDNDTYEKVYETKKVVAFKNKETGITLELINSVYYENISTCLNSFDFSITKFALFYDKNRLTLNEDYKLSVAFSERFFEDLWQQRLNIDNYMLFPISTFERMIKYIKYGYMPCRETKIKILSAIHIVRDEDLLNIGASLYDGVD